jgi:hypothetical protein
MLKRNQHRRRNRRLLALQAVEQRNYMHRHQQLL